FRAAGKLSIDSVPAVNEKYRVYYEQWRRYAGEVNPLSVFVAMIIWARVHGIVSLEIQGNLPAFGKKGDALYLFELNSIGRQFIKE
ncbi:MAG TPA: TetR-like C-terminal domain-containing protein, partial [Anaerolineales bacterium]|nr:TetR-like C-terminal domain-containing protein [Anaerolineales bacterium]